MVATSFVSTAVSAGGLDGSSNAVCAELDKLAAGGYITSEEYKTKRKAILDSM